MFGELGYVAAYVHLFYVLSCVERYVDCSRHTSAHKTTCKTNERMLPHNQVHHI
jgi:hypothetical protein